MCQEVAVQNQIKKKVKEEKVNIQKQKVDEDFLVNSEKL
jgi:hypothetical protein